MKMVSWTRFMAVLAIQIPPARQRVAYPVPDTRHTQMTIYAFASIFNSAVALFLGSLVMGKEPKSPLNRLYFSLCLLVAYISFCEFGLRLTTAEQAHIWLKAGFLWPFVLPIFLHFILHYANIKHLLAHKLTYVLLYLPAAFFSVIDLTTELISGQPVQHYWGWGYSYAPSWPNDVGMVWAAVLMLLTIVVSFTHAFSLGEHQGRKQALFVSIGVSLPVAAGLYTEVILPFAFSQRIPEMETLAFTLSSVAIGYGIWRHGLFSLSPTMAAENIFNNISDVLFLVGPDGTILRANPATKTHLGYEESEIVNNAAILASGDAASTKEFTQRVFARLKNEGRLTDLEVELRRKDGRIVPFSMSLAVLKGPNDRVLGYVCIARDIEERKLAEQELVMAKDAAEAANRAKSEFLAATSHELRTPLNAIIGFSQILQDQFFGPLNEKQIAYVDDIHQSGKHLLALINDVLDLAKVEAGKLELEPTTVLVEELFRSSLTIVKEKCLKHRIGLTFAMAPELYEQELTVDVRKIKQVMFNLLSNAAKFTPDGGRIEVSASRRGPDLEVYVEDNGAGIAIGDQEAIFEPFYQVKDDGLTSRAIGTGLGLGLTRRLLTLHGGRIFVESEGLGKGSRFTFVMPLDCTILRT